MFNLSTLQHVHKHVYYYITYNLKSKQKKISKFFSIFFQALALVDEETRRYRPTKNYLAPVLPALNINAFETPLMKTELERVASRMPMDTLSMKRYELPPPPAGKMTDVAAWNECVDNSLGIVTEI